MYLYVYILLLLSIIGLYTQLYVLRGARMEEGIKTVAEMMRDWHGAAFRLASDPTFPQLSMFPFCCNVNAAAGQGAPTVCLPGAPLSCSKTLDAVSLPSGWNTDVAFNSVVYVVEGTKYIVTFVADDASGFAALGFTGEEIVRQINNAAFDTFGVGKTAQGTCHGETGHFFFTKASDICFPTWNGTTLFVPDDAVGFVSVI